MELKEVFEKLAGMDGGAELESAIKAEVTKLRGEAAAARTKSNDVVKELKEKYQSIIETLGLQDDDQAADNVKKMKETLDGLSKSGQKPDEVLKQMSSLSKQVETVTKQLADMTKAAETEKTKRIEASKTSKAISALTAGNAANPEAIAKIIMENISVKDDGETLIFKNGEEELSIEDGTSSWLKTNPWAVKASPNAGSGASGNGGGGSDDPFLQGFDTK